MKESAASVRGGVFFGIHDAPQGMVLALQRRMSQLDNEEIEAVPEPITERRRSRGVAKQAFGALKAQHAAQRTVIEGFANGLNNIAASTPFLLIHVAWFLIWIPWNLGMFGFEPFDPFP